MNIERFASTVLIQLQAWRDELPADKINSTPLPVIAVPQEWMDTVAKSLNLGEGEEVGEIWGCPVWVQDVEYPIFIRHDGHTRVIDREWRSDAERIKAANEKRARKIERRLAATNN